MLWNDTYRIDTALCLIDTYAIDTARRLRALYLIDTSGIDTALRLQRCDATSLGTPHEHHPRTLASGAEMSSSTTHPSDGGAPVAISGHVTMSGHVPHQEGSTSSTQQLQVPTHTHTHTHTIVK